MEKVFISTPTINLDQFLKWIGIVDSGGQAKILVDDGIITVNKILVTERRKKLQPGDIVGIEGYGVWLVDSH